MNEHSDQNMISNHAAYLDRALFQGLDLHDA
jgi:hypothetical protein